MADLHPDCRFWLGRVEGNVVHLEDGCHGGPEGVAKAAKLIKRIFGDERDWVMVEMHPMPDLDPPINEDAASSCAAMVATASTQPVPAPEPEQENEPGGGDRP